MISGINKRIEQVLRLHISILNFIRPYSSCIMEIILHFKQPIVRTYFKNSLRLFQKNIKVSELPLNATIIFHLRSRWLVREMWEEQTLTFSLQTLHLQLQVCYPSRCSRPYILPMFSPLLCAAQHLKQNVPNKTQWRSISLIQIHKSFRQFEVQYCVWMVYGYYYKYCSGGTWQNSIS